MPLGQLEKMKIYAYNNAEMRDSQKVGEPFTALMNPENYTLDIKMEFTARQGHGTSGSNPSFNLKLPEEMSFEFLFDNTGIIDGNPPPAGGPTDIHGKIEAFRTFLMGYDSEGHGPNFFKLVWGGFIFKGRCTGLNIAYKLFNPDGKPIRAICKVTLKSFQEDNERAAREDARSPDLTHSRVVKKGDTLPMMCYLVYGDSRHYLEVARANRLVNFRSLEVGREIYFPPFGKAGAPARKTGA